MSNFQFMPENVHEATHSTQFSFDETLISPQFMSSPSLTNHCSNKSIKSTSSANDDVIEALSVMQNGCLMIMLKLEVTANGEVKQPSAHPMHGMEWSFNQLDSDYQYLRVNSVSSSTCNEIKIADIARVSKLHRESAESVQRALNIAGVEQIGLQAVTLRLSMKQDHSFNYYLIFDEYRTAFIFYNGLRTLVHMISIQQPITTVAVCCSSVDRINNVEMHQKMRISDEEHTHQWIQHIGDKLPLIRHHITRCHEFAQASCILDSSEHLSLLLQARLLKEMYADAQALSRVPKPLLSRPQIASLREVWLSLMADLSVALLKEHQLRADMKASRQQLSDSNF